MTRKPPDNGIHVFELLRRYWPVIVIALMVACVVMWKVSEMR